MRQVKERPILFGAPMVRAILEGRKTVTRRAISPKLVNRFDEPRGPADVAAGYPFVECEDGYWPAIDFCPYGQPGDRLWVRETWLEDPEDDGTWAYTQYMGCKGSPLSDIPKRFQKPEHCLFRASWSGSAVTWRPSIHMPRWASRILLEITAVRVERLHDISEEQAKAEGVECDSDGWFDYLMPSTQCCPSAFESFRTLWSSINSAESWDTNPWVWVVEFRRVAP
ncbi:hypothetical protein V0R50_10360 [Pseudomonas sp. 148P]|uniref:Phage-related protein n=1 Tax=Pseudomonas ulcerans TaxID=3115852 RepID=A0ABU7HQ05_9PSED|nr:MULTISPECIES: hypothetical protein [unclassified Pseudomonas]MEE1922646.1 hypothetical protein [Pseudomonas sp. 147P]MEE1933623.1 hypothetical protein [Pseudomonas sp. 148P]